VKASEYNDEMAAAVAIIDEAITVETRSVLVYVIMSIVVLLMMVFAVKDDTVKVLPTRVLKSPSLNPSCVPNRVDTVSVEFTMPKLVMRELPLTEE